MISPKQIHLIIEELINDWSKKSDYNTIDFLFSSALFSN